jgi:hypothetical protein
MPWRIVELSFCRMEPQVYNKETSPESFEIQEYLLEKDVH